MSSKEAVRRGLINAGILLQEASKPHGRQSQPKFGERRVNGKAVEYKLEQKVINAVIQMREQGLSLRHELVGRKRIGWNWLDGAY